ncbi:hypothetical protein [Streptomyces sp. NPDC102476]|uniref:hypothetical protein n=1 Tax=Streptomyces sp. NPDC102476 TaxID=3366181 RepID=UPI0038218152
MSAVRCPGLAKGIRFRCSDPHLEQSSDWVVSSTAPAGSAPGARSTCRCPSPSSSPPPSCSSWRPGTTSWHPRSASSNDQLKTLPLAPAGFSSVNGTNAPLLLATSIVVVLPCILIFFLAQRHIVGGISFTGSK